MSMQLRGAGAFDPAAPLIIDLTRFAALECRRGGVESMRHLGFFFKDPIDVDEHDLFSQWNGW